MWCMTYLWVNIGVGYEHSISLFPELVCLNNTLDYSKHMFVRHKLSTNGKCNSNKFIFWVIEGGIVCHKLHWIYTQSVLNNTANLQV